MAKDAFYFQHDYNARNDDKILELRSKFGVEGYGLFWMVIETMAENEHGGLKASLIGGLSIGYGINKQTLEDFLNFCVEIELFVLKEGFYLSNRMLKHKDFRKYLSEKGKEGVAIRENNKRGFMGGLNGGLSDPSSKERKGKENRIGISFAEDFETVCFTDGSIQKLGEQQKELAQQGKIKPHLITYGSVY